MARLFVTADIPETILKRIRTLECNFPGGRPTPPDQLHLTLRFIGEVDEWAVEEISTQLQGIKTTVFPLRLQEIGCFGRARNPSILWIGATPTDQLHLLKKKIDSRLRGVGIAGDGRRFRPHITLARLKNCSRPHLQNFLAQYSLIQSPEFQVESFSLYRSTLTPKRALHTRLERFALQSLPTEV